MYVTTSCPYFDLSFVSSDIRSVRTFKISNSTVHDHVHARKFSIVNPGHGSDRIRNGRNRKYEKGDMLITSLKLHNKSRIITWNKLVQVLLLISSYCFGLNYLNNFAGFTTIISQCDFIFALAVLQRLSLCTQRMNLIINLCLFIS
jgi:hypothetical protein